MNTTETQNPPAPLVVRCPVCLAPMRPDGTHISLTTGAHIPAATP